jgi:hypothetical protein
VSRFATPPPALGRCRAARSCADTVSLPAWRPRGPAEIGRSLSPHGLRRGQRDRGAGRQRDLAAGPPSIGEQQLRLATSSTAHRLVRLIPVAEPVDQTCGVSLRSRPRPRVDQLTNSIMRSRRSAAMAHSLVIDRFGKPLEARDAPR